MPRISAEEQLAIELINDARLNPSAEAARQGYDINEGLADGTITLDPKQPLAVNMDLNSAAIAHSNWMLDENVFAHEGEGDSSPTDRVSQTDYDLSGSWMIGENLAFATTDPSSDQAEVTNDLHDNLFASKHHRENIMEDEYTELGVGQTIGEFETEDGTSTVGMQTVNYGRSGDGKFLTGVAVNDADSDQAYDVGEGVEGVTFSAGGQSTATAEAGGYAMDLSTAEPEIDVAVTHGGKTMNVSIAHEGQNVKLDLYDGDTLASSGTMSLGEGAKNGRLLGENDLSINGNDDDNILVGNQADNILIGNAGEDALYGDGGNDVLLGGAGDDILRGGSGDDAIYGGSGADVLLGGAGQDYLEANGGTNVLIAGAGENLLQGGDDGNLFISGGMFSSMAGGAGSDYFHIADTGVVNISKFNAESDILDFGGRYGSVEDLMSTAFVRGATETSPGDLVFTHAEDLETVILGGGDLMETIAGNIVDDMDAGSRAEVVSPWFEDLSPDQAAVVADATMDSDGTSTLLGDSADAITEHFPEGVSDAVNGVLFNEETVPGDDGTHPGGTDEDPTDPGDDDDDDDDVSDGGSDGSCFVATASFGSAMHPDVTWLRTYRDEVLVTHPLGRAFIRFYWKVGPALARKVDGRPAISAASRKAISALVGMLKKR